MKLVFVSSARYPNGGAASNRHLAYSKGLKELGHEVEFILLKNQEWDEPEIKYNGIKFTSLSREDLKNASKFKKLKYHFFTLSKAKKILGNINQKETISALILLDTDISILIPLIKHGKKIGLKIFHERTEYPFVVAGKSIREKINLKLYLKFIVNQFDGIYVINNALKKYFSALTQSSVSIVNMMVDPSRFEQDSVKSDKNTVISYCGNLDDEKDGVSILIRAFAVIASIFPKTILQIIGPLNNKTTKQKMESLVIELKIEKRVLFTGYILNEEIPQLLMNSDILALARPNNKQAEGGFPTKLGEYLATGNPVVITNVGEIGLFLKDGVNAFISKPDNVEDFSKKLEEAVSSKKRIQIGLAGKELVYNEFNYLEQAKKLEKLFSYHQNKMF